MSRASSFSDSICRTSSYDITRILEQLQLSDLNIVVKDDGEDKRHLFEDQIVRGPYTIIIKANIYPANVSFSTVLFKDGKRLMVRDTSIIGKVFASNSRKLLRKLLKDALFNARDELVLNNTNNS